MTRYSIRQSAYDIRHSFVVIPGLMLIAFRWLPFHPIISYSAAFISSSVLYWFVCRWALREKHSTPGILPILVFFVLVRFTFIGTNPLGSDDVYRYMWDGRVQTAGINPYQYAPRDEALAHLHTASLPALVNHPDLKTLYFPLCEWVFYLGYHLSGEHAWGFQMIILFAEILTFLGLALLLRESSQSPWRVLLYAANPLVILQFGLDAHIDAVGFPFLIFGFLFLLRGRKTAAYLLLGCSLLIKPVALVLLPVFLLNERGLINRIRSVGIPLGVLAAGFVPYIVHINPFQGLATFSENWFFNGALFSLLLPIFSDNQTTRLWCLAFLVILIGLLALSKKGLLEKSTLALLLLLLCSPVAHPWYMGWMIVLLPLAPLAGGLALAGTASLSSITFVTYQLNGIWEDYPVVLILEYIPVVTLLWFDLKRRSSHPPSQLSNEAT
ncbi:MAG TPA: hypothetical protein VMM37_00690 [Bacteroidota bacterium]|nr:hypothetical protein [Bacteroidota bacterium]